jgi:hypothetical protein
MKGDRDLAWEVIGHDPLLRRELRLIEQQNATDETVVALMEFFGRVEGMNLCAEESWEEEFKTVRQ